MNAIKTSCPRCGNTIEIADGLENIVCASCGVLYIVRRLEGSVGLAVAPASPEPVRPASAESVRDGEIGAFIAITDRLALVEEDIESVAADLELIRSKEQGAPLQLGCALFGIFGFVVLAMGFFATVGKSFFGGWLFFITIAAIVLLSLKGLRKRLMSPGERRALVVRRSRLEGIFEQLQNDRQALKQTLDGLGHK